MGPTHCPAAALLICPLLPVGIRLQRRGGAAWAGLLSRGLPLPTRPAAAPRSSACRLGKFLADVDTLRKTRLHAPFAALEWLAAGGECVYYFTEQLIWWVAANGGLQGD